MTSPAPQPLEIVRAFVNTRDIEANADAISTPSGLSAWLQEWALLPSGVTARPADVRRAITVRESLREALAANHDGAALPPAAIAVLNQTSERARLSLELTSDAGWSPRPRAEGIDGAVGKLLAIVVTSMAAGTWRRLKVCENDTCRWAFYDNSRARSGKWCSMQICGNRLKQQAWRSRHPGSSAGP